jgi:hypothetical protein
MTDEPDRIERTVVHDEKHGVFRIRTVQLDRPHYAAFRWLPSGDDAAEPSTLVEFWIEAGAGGGSSLRVLESGFDAPNISPEERRRQIEGNIEGWQIEFDAAQRFLQSR